MRSDHNRKWCISWIKLTPSMVSASGEILGKSTIVAADVVVNHHVKTSLILKGAIKVAVAK